MSTPEHARIAELEREVKRLRKALVDIATTRISGPGLEWPRPEVSEWQRLRLQSLRNTALAAIAPAHTRKE